MGRMVALNGMFGLGATTLIDRDSVFAAARRGLVDGSKGMTTEELYWLQTYASTPAGQADLQSNQDVLQSMRKFESYLQRLGAKISMTPEQYASSRTSPGGGGGLLDKLTGFLTSSTSAITSFNQPAQPARLASDDSGGAGGLLLAALVVGGGGFALYKMSKGKAKGGRARRR